MCNTIAVAPNAPNIIYAGGHSGPYRSTDGGATWTKTPITGLPVICYCHFDGGRSHQRSSCLRRHDKWRSFSRQLTVATTGAQLRPFLLTLAGVFAIVFDPVTPSTMYVGSSDGVFKSTDSGATWTALNNFGLRSTLRMSAHSQSIQQRPRQSMPAPLVMVSLKPRTAAPTGPR